MSHKMSQKLTVEQENAIDLLVTGMSDREVAEKVGVTRETVCRWRNENEGFFLMLNRQRQEVWGHSMDRLRTLVPKAVEALEDGLNADGLLQVQSAVHILKSVGCYGSNLYPSGPTTVNELERQKRDQENAEKLYDHVIKIST